MGLHPGSTRSAKLGAGEVAAVGTRGVYRRLAVGPGQARVVVDELGTHGRRIASSRSLVYLVHLTDLQLADVHSPGRFEFIEELRGVPGAGPLVPAQRPQEALAPHAVAEMVREIRRRLESPDTGAPLALALSTGDSIDNAQWNELEWYLSLMGGGSVSVGQGRAYEGVQRADWPVDFYWKPDVTDGRFQRELGFPTLPGLLDRAVAPFAVAGLPVGWVSCFGNHEGLPFGVSLPTEQYRSVVTGARKPFALPDGLSPIGNVEDLYRHPERYLEGPARGVAPDPSRRLIGRRDFVAAHLAAPGKPAGHGFGAHNLEEGTAYNALDVGGSRLVLLDTANLDGAADGSIGARQLAWLEEQLVAVHSRYRAADGSFVTTSNTDRLVVLASHHGLVSMRDRGPVEGGLEPDHPRVGAQELRALLHRFPNVVLWLSGHRHVSEVAVHLARLRSPRGVTEPPTDGTRTSGSRTCGQPGGSATAPTSGSGEPCAPSRRPSSGTASWPWPHDAPSPSSASLPPTALSGEQHTGRSRCLLLITRSQGTPQQRWSSGGEPSGTRPGAAHRRVQV